MIPYIVFTLFLVITASALTGILLFNKDQLEQGFHYLSSFFVSNDIQSIVRLKTPVTDTSWLTTEGDLTTYIQIGGSRRLIGPADFDKLASRFAKIVGQTLSDGTGKQHEIDVGFLSDPRGTPHVISEMLAPSLVTSSRLGTGERAKKWFSSRAATLSAVCSDEMVVLAFTTLRSGLSPKDRQRIIDRKLEMNAKVRKEGGSVIRGANPAFSQTMDDVPPSLLSRHEAAVENLQYNLGHAEAGLDVMIKILGCKDSAWSVKRFVTGGKLPRKWRPALFGNTTPAGSAANRESDMANMMPMPIARQIFTEKTKEHFKDIEHVAREGMYYASVKLDVFPHETPLPSFSQFRQRIGREFPVAINFCISPDGMSTKKLEQNFSAFFGGFGEHNKSIKRAWNALKALKQKGDYIGAIRVVFSTWATSEEKLSDQISSLKMAVQSWGGSTASNESGAPGVLHVATAPGLARYNVAPILPGPLSAFARMMPVFNPGSPWDTGQLILRTPGGRLYPIAFGTEAQTFWGTIIFAPPGKGKSFLLNSLNMGLAFSPGQTDLPYITVVDVGLSSKNVVNTLRSILPDSKKHQAVSIRLRNDQSYSINPFDTQLGADRPTERERDFQVAIVTALSPNLGEEAGRFIGAVIDAAYSKNARTSIAARKWQRAFDLNLSKIMEEQGIEINENLRVWDVVDRLFDAGFIHEATIAQRYAVPTLDSLIAAARTDEVQNNFRTAPTPSREMITDVFTRSITTATREYALLSTTTKFDIGDARVVAIDLEEIVSTTDSEEGRRRSAIMIMFARQMGAKNYFLKWDEVEPLLPSRYKTYQKNRVARIFETLKFLEYDEFHVAKGIKEVQGLAESDFRVGRKYNVVTLLSSQLIEDFSKGMIECATNIFILGTGTTQAAMKLKEIFSLSDTEISAITSECLGPGPKGAPLFGIFKTTQGDVTQILYNSASPMEKWAFSSSAIDVQVRNNVAELRGGNEWEALELLVREFPNGSARSELEQLKLNMTEESVADEAGVAMTIAKLAISRDIAAQNSNQYRAAA